MAASSGGSLHGVRVIDLTTIVAGPSCTQILGDHGADVIKVEAPAGEPGRGMGLSYDQAGFSSHFFSMNRNKRSVSLDLGKPEGAETLLRMLETADVLISNFKPGTMEKFGLGYEAVLGKRFPRLIAASVSAFGSDGPLGGLPGYDPVAQGMSGFMNWQGEPDGPPMRVGVSLVDLGAGLYLTSAILLALYERTRSGLGQAIEVTLLEAGLTFSHPYAADWYMSGCEPKRIGNRHPSAAPYNVFRCRDGYMILCCANNAQFRRLCEILGRPGMADDPRFRELPKRFENQDAVDAEVAALCRDRDKQEISLRLLRAGVPAGPILSMGEALSNPQLAAREFVMEDKAVGYRNIGTPIRMGRTPGALRRVPPRFGEHNRKVLREAGFSADEIDALVAGRVVFETPVKG